MHIIQMYNFMVIYNIIIILFINNKNIKNDEKNYE